MMNKTQRSFERVAEVLKSVYGIVKVFFDFYMLVHGR
jgi:hypothetical protein